MFCFDGVDLTWGMAPYVGNDAEDEVLPRHPSFKDLLRPGLIKNSIYLRTSRLGPVKPPAFPCEDIKAGLSQHSSPTSKATVFQEPTNLLPPLPPPDLSPPRSPSRFLAKKVKVPQKDKKPPVRMA
ncbi:unnamed protein product [Danaus chrysippus]|uniref:(African queen) hypothetical protein n=1 Tax=Danaus chrysippus TaxID=151541 RepID=A0A8J2VY51_9NEOP|nr:unnamed protein product [Danaus chrysippus]